MFFWLYFCAPKIKSTSQARIKHEIFANFKPEPDPKSPARPTTLLHEQEPVREPVVTDHCLKL